MIIDLSVANFRSYQDEQIFSLNVESGSKRLQGNYCKIEGGRYSILKSAAIFGPNASGKSNLLTAFKALEWMITKSWLLNEGDSIPKYEPFKLAAEGVVKPVEFEIEFVVPSSGIRYRYSISYTKERVISESLYSYPKLKRALIFSRGDEDTWETIRFGSSYKGGERRIPFFKNSTYISRAGNDASAPESIREVVRYFRSIFVIGGWDNLVLRSTLFRENYLKTISDLIHIADTGVKNITAEKTESPENIQFPEGMPEDLKAAILEENRVSYKFLHQSQSGELIKFDRDEISDGTNKLFEILPLLLQSISTGSPIFIDELNGRLHPSLVSLVLDLFHDPLINPRNAQIIFTTHDTNIMDSSKLRRDQIWLVEKENGATKLHSLNEYDKSTVRSDSPFEDFYKDGRFGALPKVSYIKIRDAIAKIMPREEHLLKAEDDA